MCIMISIHVFMYTTRGTCMFECGSCCKTNQIATNQSYLNKNTTLLENMLKQHIYKD